MNEAFEDMVDVNPMPEGCITVSDAEGDGVKLSNVKTSILTDCEALTKMFNIQELDEPVTRIPDALRIFVTGVGKSGYGKENRSKFNYRSFSGICKWVVIGYMEILENWN